MTSQMRSLLQCALQGRLPGGLIVEPRQAFVPSQNRENLEDSRRGGASGQGGPQGLGDGAKFKAVLVREGAHCAFRLRSRPVLDRFEGDAKPADQLAALRG